MGVGSFKFSKEESEREKQMAFFKKIEIEVSSERKVNTLNSAKNNYLLFYYRQNQIKPQMKFID
jgi:hypothetical protein